MMKASQTVMLRITPLLGALKACLIFLGYPTCLRQFIVSGMLPTRTVLKKITTWVLGAVVVAIIVAVVGQWFIQVATDKGWYRNAGRRWDGVMNALLSLWVLFPTSILAGFVGGLWADARLAKKERTPLEDEARQHFIDRIALAKDAEALAREISALAGQGHARHAIAWQEDTEHFRSVAISSPGPMRDRSTRERAVVIERYGEKYHADAWRIINVAGRVIPLDTGDIWKLQHILQSGHEIESMANFLMAISNELQYPNEPLVPMQDRRAVSQIEDS